MKKIARFNQVFKDINLFKGRYRILKGGAGSGKSYNIAQDYILKLSDNKYAGANLLVVRKTEASHRDSTYAELQSAIVRLFGEQASTIWKFVSDPMRIICRSTGNEIAFRGMNDIQQRERIKSISFKQGKLCWIWAEEASELMQADIEMLDDRLRGQLFGALFYQITLTFNPVSYATWIKRRFFDYEDSEVLTNHSTYQDNRFIDEAFFLRMEKRREWDITGYTVYGLGEWGRAEGNIFTNYTAKEFDEQLERFDAIALGQDFGFNHFNVLLLCGYLDGNIYIIQEQIERERDTQEIIARCFFDKRIIMWCDCAEPDRIREWRKAGYNARAVVKGMGSVKAQIDWLKGRKIIIHPRCEHTLREIQGYCWKKDRVSGEYLDEPTSNNDDAMAALRYCIEGWRRGERFSFD